MRSDEQGQMMLLAAIVLLIAFVSMAVMISRVTLVASETSREQHGPFLREADAVATTLAMLNVTYTTNAQYEPYIQDLQAFEAQRGFLLSWECTAGRSVAGYDVFRLTDGRSTTEIKIYGANDCPA